MAKKVPQDNIQENAKQKQYVYMYKSQLTDNETQPHYTFDKVDL